MFSASRALYGWLWDSSESAIRKTALRANYGYRRCFTHTLSGEARHPEGNALRYIL